MEENLGKMIMETFLSGITGVVFFRVGLRLRKHPQSLELGAGSRMHKTNERRGKWLKSVKNQGIALTLASFLCFFVFILNFIVIIGILFQRWGLYS